MIKEGLILALLTPLLFKPRAVMVADNDGGDMTLDPPPLPPMPELPGLEPLSVATAATVEMVGGVPWPELPEMKTPEAAVAEFLDELVEEAGAGATMRFSDIAHSYEQMRRGRAKSDDCDGYAPRAWPAIKDRSLSIMLCNLGCEREKQSTRVNGRRLTYLTLVPAQAVDEDEVVSAMPLLMAA